MDLKKNKKYFGKTKTSSIFVIYKKEVNEMITRY